MSHTVILMAFVLTLVALLLRSMSGRVGDNHHDGHADDGEE